MARLVADLPVLKAAVATRDAPTVQPIAEEYGKAMNPDLLVVTDPLGMVLASTGTSEGRRGSTKTTVIGSTPSRVL